METIIAKRSIKPAISNERTYFVNNSVPRRRVLLEDKSEFDSNSNKTITYLGFKNTDNNKEFLNTNSDLS